MATNTTGNNTKVNPKVNTTDRDKVLAALANHTGSTITSRLRALTPGIHLEKHVKFNGDLKVGPTILEGVSFEPVDSGMLYDEIVQAKDFTGKRAFTDPVKVENDHLPLKLSFLATKGTGFREVGRAFLAEPLPRQRQPWERPQMDLGFGSQFGTQSVKINLSALHWAVSPMGCNVHIDESGFVLQLDTGEAVGPNMVQHIVEELLNKDKFISSLPEKLRPFFRRFTFIYPNAANGFSRWGKRIDATPILKKIADLPAVGGVIGRAPLPGLNFEILRGKKYKFSYTYSCGVSEGGCSHTLNLEGVW